MRYLSKIAIIISIGLLFYSNIHSRVEEKPEESVLKLRSDDAKERQSAKQGIIEERQKKIRGIEDVVKDCIEHEDRKAIARDAIEILGDLRAAESIPLLCKHLTFKYPLTIIKRLPTLSDLYPCVDALIKIGSASLEPILNTVAWTDEEEVAKCTAFVVFSVLGQETSLIYVDNRIKKEKYESRKKRLEKVKNIIATEQYHK